MKDEGFTTYTVYNKDGVEGEIAKGFKCSSQCRRSMTFRIMFAGYKQ